MKFLDQKKLVAFLRTADDKQMPQVPPGPPTDALPPIQSPDNSPTANPTALPSLPPTPTSPMDSPDASAQDRVEKLRVKLLQLVGPSSR